MVLFVFVCQVSFEISGIDKECDCYIVKTLGLHLHHLRDRCKEGRASLIQFITYSYYNTHCGCVWHLDEEIRLTHLDDDSSKAFGYSVQF